MRPSLRAARAAAEYAKLRAMRMVERHLPRRLAQGAAEFELRIIGKKRAGHHRRMRAALALDHHARGGTHRSARGCAEQLPIRGADLRGVGMRIHLREQQQIPGIPRIELYAVPGKELGETLALGVRILAPHGAAGDRDVEAVAGEPLQPFEGRPERAGAALVLVARLREMIERDPKLQPGAAARSERQQLGLAALLRPHGVVEMMY